MGTFVFTHPLIFMLVVVLAGSSYEVKAAQSCNELKDTNCSSCINKGDHCYWCPTSGECSEWDWPDYPSCKGNGYFYGQCNLSGVGIIVIFSIGVFLLVAIASCCICCCCCYMRHRRRRVVRPVRIITDDMRERQRLFQRRNEIRHRYDGLDTNDSTV